MSEKIKSKQPDWKKWGNELLIPWYDRNDPQDLELPEDSTSEGWQQWGESIYEPWYEINKPQEIEAADSNPNDPPPPPPGPIKP